MKGPERIATPRLVLSVPTPADAHDLFERYASDADVTRFLGWPRHRSIADTEAFLAFSAAEWQRWPAGPYLIRARDDGRLLGSTGLGFETADRAATGYVLARDVWGHGFATEALRAMVALARETHVARLYALCHPQHGASVRVLEKCGFTRDLTWTRQIEFPNLDPGRVQDVFCYALSLERRSANATTLPSNRRLS